MNKALSGQQEVEAAVSLLQERLSDGDPNDEALRAHCESVLSALRATYRADPKVFSTETIEALRELSDLLGETVSTPPKTKK